MHHAAKWCVGLAIDAPPSPVSAVAGELDGGAVASVYAGGDGGSDSDGGEVALSIGGWEPTGTDGGAAAADHVALARQMIAIREYKRAAHVIDAFTPVAGAGAADAPPSGRDVAAFPAIALFLRCYALYLVSPCRCMWGCRLEVAARDVPECADRRCASQDGERQREATRAESGGTLLAGSRGPVNPNLPALLEMPLLAPAEAREARAMLHETRMVATAAVGGGQEAVDAADAALSADGDVLMGGGGDGGMAAATGALPVTAALTPAAPTPAAWLSRAAGAARGAGAGASTAGGAGGELAADSGVIVVGRGVPRSASSSAAWLRTPVASLAFGLPVASVDAGAGAGAGAASPATWLGAAFGGGAADASGSPDAPSEAGSAMSLDESDGEGDAGSGSGGSGDGRVGSATRRLG